MFLLYFGHVNFDTILRVSRLPGKGESTEVLNIFERIGGTAYNAYMGLRALGVPVHLFTVVGEDFSDKLEGWVIKGSRTPRCWIVSDGKEQSAFMYQGLWKNEEELHIDFDALGEYEYLHFSTGNPKFYLKVAREGKRKGAKIAFDPSQEIHYVYDRRMFRELLDLADLFFCNEREYEKAEEYASDILYSKIIVRTEGDRGASLYLPEEGWKHFPANKVDVVDTTGAGDSFRAGFYAALYHGYSIEDAVKCGNSIAAKVVSSTDTYYTGPWDGSC